MKVGLKIIESKYYLLKILLKRKFEVNKNLDNDVHLLRSIIEKYAHKKRVVVLCNGPSANLFTPSKEALYLVTNSGKKLVRDLDYLYYINDLLYIQKSLALSSFLKKGTKVLFYYNNSFLHKKGLNFLMKNLSLLSRVEKYFISSELEDLNALKNYDDFISFYDEKSIKVKVQNSGMFLLLFGYYLSCKLKLPLDIYGLDMGEGGVVHFDGKGVIGSSVTENRVKKNVKLYLDYMYQNKELQIKNYSYFNSNLSQI